MPLFSGSGLDFYKQNLDTLVAHNSHENLFSKSMSCVYISHIQRFITRIDLSCLTLSKHDLVHSLQHGLL